MKNRIASLILAFALLMSLCSSAMARDNRIVVQSGGAERFTDVPTSHWAYAYVNKVVGSGLFKGRTETTFAPSDAMTRAQFVVVMARMEGLGDLERVETVTTFPDVASTYWAAGPIAWATQAGIVGGFGDGTFKPLSPITRGQFAALIHRYITMKRYVNLRVLDPEPAQFTDAASVSSAFVNDVEYARIHGLLTGYSDGTVRASNPITRAAIAAILARFLDLVQESGYTPLLDGPVIDGGGSDTGKTDDGQTTTPPSTTNSGYDDITLSVVNGSRGTTSVASVLRNSQPVAADDVQRGDRVTISHVPQSGYVARVSVKDASGKNVAVNRVNANTSWFYAPRDLPVTVTVTYEQESSGGGGGGGGGGSTSSSGGGGGNPSGPVTTTYTYHQKAQGIVTLDATGAAHGKVYVAITDTAPTVATLANFTATEVTGTKTLATAFANFMVYAIITPDAGYQLDGEPVIAGGTLASSNVVGSSYVYGISVRSTARTAAQATTVTVTAAFTAITAENNTYSLELQTANKDGSTPVKGSADYTGEPVYNTNITVNAVPFTDPGDPYENYHVDSVTVYKADGVTKIYDVAALNGAYTFLMPAEDVIVKVVFDKDTPDTYTYSVNLTVEGKGTAVVTAELADGSDANARITQNVTDGSYTNASGGVENAGPYTVTVEVPRGVAAPSIVAYLTSATPAQNYEVNAATRTGKANGVTIAAGASGTLNAKFDQVHSYGYNLTVIGEGQVTVDFDNKSYNTATPSTFRSADIAAHMYTASSGSVINGATTVNVSGVTAATNWQIVSVKIGDAQFNANASGVLPNTVAQAIPADTLIDIIVTFREVTAKPVNVRLTSVTGSGNVTMDGILATSSANLQNGTFATTGLTGLTAGNWYAYSGTSVTVLPIPSDPNVYVVESVTATYPDNATNTTRTLSDELDTDGFSFTVPRTINDGDAVSITVVFKEIDRYEITVQAPYQMAVNQLKSFTKVMLADAAESVKVIDVLRAKNNGAWTITNPALNIGVSTPTTDSKNIINECYQTADHLTTLVGVFVNNHSDDIAPKLPADPASLKSVVDSILSTQIESRRPTIEATIRTQLNNITLPASLTQNQLVTTGANANELTGAAKEQAINGAAALKSLLDSGLVTRDNIHPWARVTPVLLASQETLDARLTGKSMETVLVDQLTTHLKSDITVPVTSDDVESTLSITAGAMSGHALPITVTATADLKKTLTSNITQPFTSNVYTDTMIPYVVADMYVKIDNVPITITVYGVSQTTDLYTLATTPGGQYYNEQLAAMCNPASVTGLKVVTDVAPLSKYSADAASTVKTNLVSALSTVDTTIKAQIDSAFSNLNSVAVPIASILNKDLMDQFLLGEGQYLDQLIQRLNTSIAAIAPGTHTKQAVEDLYNSYVVFNNGAPMSNTTPISTIGLRTGKGNVSNFAEINAANPYQLVITINFEEHWRDPSAGDDTPYEKLIDLALNLRDSISQDIQANGSTTAKSVVAGMIQGRLNNSQVIISVKKWGAEKTSAQLNVREKKELADLLADLLMSDVNETTMKAAWDKFATKGYQMVDFSVSKRVTGQYADVLQALTSGSSLRAGFKVELITKD